MWCCRIQEEHAVMAMTLNAADTLLLLNVANQGVHLWDIREHIPHSSAVVKKKHV